jgi:stage II sporulation protein D
MMRAIALLIVCALSAINAAAQAASSTMLTVRVFSERRVDAITVTPLSSDAWMRTCARCPRQTISAPLSLQYEAGQIRLTPATTSKDLQLSGALRLKARGFDQEVRAAGIWKIVPGQTGLRILITVPSERYVAAALNGEAAPDEPLASLKAMAVAARTFALVNQNRHREEGFGLCDSTHCQALRFGSSRPEIERAVQETAGETLWLANQRAHIYYTQNCGGMTEDAAQEWPAEDAIYLRSHPDPYCIRRPSSEWRAQIPLDQLGKIFHDEGWRTPPHFESVRVTKQTASGRALLLEFSGNGMHAPISASSFRFAINRALGWNTIRSDWYKVSIAGALLHVDGKGYGHGVGLCQAGAYEMAAEGHDYRQILGFYFPGTAIRITAGDSGWRSMEGIGWTLRSATSQPELTEAGNAAWSKAQQLFPRNSPIHPVVFSLPTTDLFRQLTSEPGWVLASTRGSNIYLQPTGIIRKSGTTQATLLHEFLHVLVEQEAAQSAPLWLREGLVAVLAGSNQHDSLAGPRMLPAQIEVALAHPADQHASQRAHALAFAMVSELIQRYGLAAVRSWLQSGVPAGIANNLPDVR